MSSNSSKNTRAKQKQGKESVIGGLLSGIKKRLFREEEMRKDKKLYWNNKPLVTEQKLVLQLWVNIAIIIASISTLGMAIIATLQFFGFGLK